MHKATNSFAVNIENGVVKAVGKSVICQPKTSYSGKKTKWYEDKPKQRD